MDDDKKKYSHMENVFQYINKKHVSLQDDMKKQYNVYQEVVRTIIGKMRETSTLFDKMFRSLFYGGSYYDGLKISKPEEYDLDLLLKLPEYAKPKMSPSDLPGFVHVQLSEYEKFTGQPEYKAYYTDLPKLLDKEQFLDAENVKNWMESLITKTLNKFKKSGDQHVLTCEVSSKNLDFFVKMVKGGPAFTLQINNEDMRMDVDLVPCFVFDDKWPSHCKFKANPCPSNNSFFIVPKKPRGAPKDKLVARCWRMSFQIQERELIKDRKYLKPALKLMKKLRDKLDHKSISSYFLKTIFLYEVKKRDKNFWESNIVTVFMEMLNAYATCLESKRIPYFWNEKHNMIEHIGDVQLDNIKNKIKNIIADVERNVTDPFAAAKHLVNPSELEQMKSEVNLGKRALSTRQKCFSSGLTMSSQGCIESITPRPIDAIDIVDCACVPSAKNTKPYGIEQIMQGIDQKLSVIVRKQEEMSMDMKTLMDRVLIGERSVNNRDLDNLLH